MMLEIQVSDLLQKPIGQIAPPNLLDLIALSELGDDVPKRLKRGLQGFADRVVQDIADLPAGQSWAEFLEQLDGVEGSRVPTRFRDMLTDENGKSIRHGQIELAQALLSSWADHEPEPFVLGTQAPKVQRATAANAPSERRTRGSSGTRSSSSSSSTSRSSKPKVSRPKPVVDIDRQNWISDICLERLATAPETGLSQNVLIAGIRHRAREHYPDLLGPEITKVLKMLEGQGRVRHSAGRWRRAGRW